MLVESTAVVDEAIVDKTVSKLRSLALTPSSSSVPDVNLAAFHHSQCSTSSSCSTALSSKLSPPAFGCQSDAPNDDDPVIRPPIDDLFKPVCGDRIAFHPAQVTDRCDRIRSFSVGPDRRPVRERTVEERCRIRSPSPLLTEAPFQASSLLDLFYDDNSKLSDEAVLHDSSIDLHPKIDDHCKSEPGLEADCDTIEIDGCRDRLENWNELWDISLDPMAFASELPSSELPADIPVARHRSDGLVYFYEHTEFTPADLLPLYQPELPLEYSFPKPESSLPAVFTVDDVSDLQRLHQDDAAHAFSEALPQISGMEPVSEDYEFNNIQDLVSALSDEDCQRLYMTADDENVELPLRSKLCSASASLEGQEFSNGQNLQNSDRTESPVPIRSRIRRKMSNQSYDGQSGAKRSRFLLSERPSKVEIHFPGIFKYARARPYDGRCVNISAEQIWDEDYQAHRCHSPDDNLRSRTASFIKHCCYMALKLLVLIWQFWSSLLTSLASVPCDIISRVHCQHYLLWASSFVHRLSCVVEFGRERFMRRKYRCWRERRYMSNTQDPFGHRPSKSEATKPVITVVQDA